MERLGHLVKVEDREIELAHSDRSKTPVRTIPLRSWFVKMDVLAENAINAVRDGASNSFRRGTPKHTSTGWARSATGASAGSCGGGIRFQSGTARRVPKPTWMPRARDATTSFIVPPAKAGAG